MKKDLEVVAAIVKKDNKILCMQKNKGKYDYISLKFEFPGGKIEKGETKCQALRRELKEEMDVDIVIEEKDRYLSVCYEYPDFCITLHSFLITVEDFNFTMKEHLSFKWLNPDELENIDWAAADYPIVKQLKKEFK